MAKLVAKDPAEELAQKRLSILQLAYRAEHPDQA